MCIIWEGTRGDYESYMDFKKSFDPKTKIFSKIWTTIKSDLSTEIKGLVKAKDVFRIDSSSPMYRNITLDPAKRADYFAHLSENKPTQSKAAMNTKNTYRGDLIEESERKYKSERKHRSHHKHSKNETVISSRRADSVVAEPSLLVSHTQENVGETTEEGGHRHRRRHHHSVHSHRHHSHNNNSRSRHSNHGSRSRH